MPFGSLRDEKPYLLQKVPRNPLGPMRIRRIQRGLPSLNVRLCRRHPPGALEEFPEKVQPKVDRDADISRYKVIDFEALGWRREDVEAVEEDDERKEDETGVGGVGLEGGFEDQGVPIDALGAEGVVEFEVGDRDGNPGEEVSDCGQVLEPLEDGAAAGGAGHVGQEGYKGSYYDAVIWDAPGEEFVRRLLSAWKVWGNKGGVPLRTAKEKPWGLAVLCQGVQVSRASVEESVGGRGS